MVRQEAMGSVRRERTETEGGKRNIGSGLSQDQGCPGNTLSGSHHPPGYHHRAFYQYMPFLTYPLIGNTIVLAKHLSCSFSQKEFTEEPSDPRSPEVLQQEGHREMGLHASSGGSLQGQIISHHSELWKRTTAGRKEERARSL